MVKSYNDGQWTEGRFRGFVTSSLRSAFRRWPPKWSCLDQARVGKRKSASTGREAMHYGCAECGKSFPKLQVQVDHKVRIGPCSTWDEFIERLFCDGSNLQVLCKPCHKAKTKAEATFGLPESKKEGAPVEYDRGYKAVTKKKKTKK